MFLVVGEIHNPRKPVPSETPRWLIIPQRGLFTGIVIIGAVGTGKTSCCMYPFVEQLVAYKAQDAEKKVGRLVLEVKGDFCHQVKEILTRHGRAKAYIEISLDSEYRYNPLHNDLDAYALAYSIASLLNNLFGKGNGSNHAFIERAGVLEEIPGLTLSEKSLLVAVRNIARRLGNDISEAKLILDSRLPDGSRVAAVIPPCGIYGVTLTIRKFNRCQFTVEDLVRMGTLNSELSARLQGYVQNRQNILISGGTASGKTTLLNTLGKFIADEDRILLIEDTSEIQLEKPNLFRFEARQAQPDMPAITIRDLLKASLRHRPDGIILGEIRGGEAFDLLQLLNTGHSGTLSTVHASSGAQALARFTSCVLQSGIELPYRAIKSNIADSLNVLIQLERRPGKRFIADVLEIRGYNSENDRYDLSPVFAARL